MCAAAGFLALLLCVSLLSRRRGLNPDETVVAALVSMVGVVLGASLLYGITNIPLMVRIVDAYAAGSYAGFGDFARDIASCFGGFVFYGGLGGGVAACCLYARHRRWRVGEVLDVLAVGVPLFHVFGRIGCFLGGCCYGVESSWGIVYAHSPIEQANGVVRVPIQLIEAACNAGIFAVLLGMFVGGRARGRLLAVYGVMYGTVRFVDEFWRGDAYRGIWGPFSTSQWISLAVVAVCAAVLAAWFIRRGRETEKSENIFSFNTRSDT